MRRRLRDSSIPAIRAIGRGCAAWARVRLLLLAAALVVCSSSASIAAPILAEVVGCTGGALGTCTVEPVGGPVDVDPLGFTLEVIWGPDYIFFTEDPGGGTQDGLMNLFFDFTGTHEGTEHLGIDIAFLDAAGNPIPGLVAGFDDLNAVGGVVTAHYYIFGPSTAIHGFFLELSEGSGVTTMAWTRATIWPAALVEVPEPSILYLLGAGLGVAIRRRRASA